MHEMLQVRQLEQPAAVLHTRRVLPIGLQHDRVQLGLVLGRQQFAATVATAAVAIATAAVATAAVAIATAANRRRNLPGKLRGQCI